MVQIKKFLPADSRSASASNVNLKDPITFLVGDLGPFDPNLLQQGKRVSLIPSSTTWRRCTYEQAKQQASNNLYLAADSAISSLTDTILESDARQIPPGLKFASPVDIQTELETARILREIKLQQPSSLTRLNFASTTYPFVELKSFSLATKGEVLSQSSQETNLFLTTTSSVSSKNYTMGYKIIDGNTIEVDSLSPFALSDVDGYTTSFVPYVTLIAVGASTDQKLDISSSNPKQQIISTGVNNFLRKVLFFKVKELIQPKFKQVADSSRYEQVQKPRIKLEATDFSPIQIVPWFFKQTWDQPDVGLSSSQPPGAYIWDETTGKALPTASTDPYLFTIPEIKLINNCLLGSFMAIAGYPILSNQSSIPTKVSSVVATVNTTTSNITTSNITHTSAKFTYTNSYQALLATLQKVPQVAISIPSLEDYQALIQAEIPKTKLFSVTLSNDQVSSKSGIVIDEEKRRFVGNLDRTSLSVTIVDSDSPVILVKEGEAQEGCSIDYKLYTQADMNNGIEYGDVLVTISMEAFPTRVLILGQPAVGAEGVQLGVSLKPQSKTFTQSDGTQTLPPQGEYVFSRSKTIRGVEGSVPASYGTLRVFDKVKFITKDASGSTTTLGSATIARVDTTTNIVFFTSPLDIALPLNTFMEIPQSPLNPGRTYRVQVSCSDRIATVKNGGIPIYPS